VIAPELQAALDAPLRETPSIEAADLQLLRARMADDGWPETSLFGSPAHLAYEAWKALAGPRP
jgi:hypothetical protein